MQQQDRKKVKKPTGGETDSEELELTDVASQVPEVDSLIGNIAKLLSRTKREKVQEEEKPQQQRGCGCGW